MSKESGLTKRQKTIIQMLVQFTFSNPVTVQAISEKLRLSSRTILRELPKIEEWMEENDFHMVRKPRVGIYLEEDEESRALILELVKADHTKSSVMEKDERVFYFLCEILASREPLKYYYFTSKFGISEGTLVSDLDEIEKWIDNYGISLVRRKGLGVYWTGSEQDYRQAVVTLILEALGKEDATASDQKEKRRKSNPLFTLYSEEKVSFIQEMIKSAEQNLQIRYTDNAFKRMTVLLTVTIKRMEEGQLIRDFATEIESLMRYPEYQVATWIGSMLEASLKLEITQEEIAFITMQLLSAKIWQPQIMNKYESGNSKNRQMVIHMILKVEKLLDMDFLDDRMLIDGLCNHIAPAISRMKMHVRIENHNVDMLKQKYGDIFEAVRAAAEILEREIGVDTICEEELGFIVLHFCAAAEKNRSKGGKVSIVVACPSGIGTSHMLAVHLQKTFSEVIVRKVIATSEIDAEYLKKEGIELIVSTAKLDTEFPHVCVNPVLLENDRMVLRNVLKDLKKSRDVQKNKSIRKKRVRHLEMEYLVTLGKEILQVLDNVKISPEDFVTSKEELLTKASFLFARDDAHARIIEQDIRAREMVAGTYISTFHMLFLHCKTKGVKHCRFGYIALKKPFISGEGIVLGAIVMLIPQEEGDQQKIYQEVMSEVSGSLAENDQIISKLCLKKRNEVSFELEKSLGNYYQQVIKKYGGN